MVWFFEAQASLTETSYSSGLKKRVEQLEWEIHLSGSKDPWKVAQKIYIYENCEPSQDEISIIGTCSENIR